MQVRDAGNLLTTANFTLQTVDTDDMTVQYEDVTQVVEHLRVCLLKPHVSIPTSKLVLWSRSVYR